MDNSSTPKLFDNNGQAFKLVDTHYLEVDYAFNRITIKSMGDIPNGLKYYDQLSGRDNKWIYPIYIGKYTGKKKFGEHIYNGIEFYFTLIQNGDIIPFFTAITGLPTDHIIEQNLNNLLTTNKNNVVSTLQTIIDHNPAPASTPIPAQIPTFSDFFDKNGILLKTDRTGKPLSENDFLESIVIEFKKRFKYEGNVDYLFQEIIINHNEKFRNLEVKIISLFLVGLERASEEVLNELNEPIQTNSTEANTDYDTESSKKTVEIKNVEQSIANIRKNIINHISDRESYHKMIEEYSSIKVYLERFLENYDKLNEKFIKLKEEIEKKTQLQPDINPLNDALAKTVVQNKLKEIFIESGTLNLTQELHGRLGNSTPAEAFKLLGQVFNELKELPEWIDNQVTNNSELSAQEMVTLQQGFALKKTCSTILNNLRKIVFTSAYDFNWMIPDVQRTIEIKYQDSINSRFDDPQNFILNVNLNFYLTQLEIFIQDEEKGGQERNKLISNILSNIDHFLNNALNILRNIQYSGQHNESVAYKFLHNTVNNAYKVLKKYEGTIPTIETPRIPYNYRVTDPNSSSIFLGREVNVKYEYDENNIEELKTITFDYNKSTFIFTFENGKVKKTESHPIRKPEKIEVLTSIDNITREIYQQALTNLPKEYYYEITDEYPITGVTLLTEKGVPKKAKIQYKYKYIDKDVEAYLEIKEIKQGENTTYEVGHATQWHENEPYYNLSNDDYGVFKGITQNVLGKYLNKENPIKSKIHRHLQSKIDEVKKTTDKIENYFKEVFSTTPVIIEELSNSTLVVANEEVRSAATTTDTTTIQPKKVIPQTQQVPEYPQLLTINKHLGIYGGEKNRLDGLDLSKGLFDILYDSIKNAYDIDSNENDIDSNNDTKHLDEIAHHCFLLIDKYTDWKLNQLTSNGPNQEQYIKRTIEIIKFSLQINIDVLKLGVIATKGFYTKLFNILDNEKVAELIEYLSEEEYVNIIGFIKARIQHYEEILTQNKEVFVGNSATKKPVVVTTMSYSTTTTVNDLQIYDQAELEDLIDHLDKHAIKFKTAWRKKVENHHPLRWVTAAATAFLASMVAVVLRAYKVPIVGELVMFLVLELILVLTILSTLAYAIFSFRHLSNKDNAEKTRKILAALCIAAVSLSVVACGFFAEIILSIETKTAAGLPSGQKLIQQISDLVNKFNEIWKDSKEAVVLFFVAILALIAFSILTIIIIVKSRNHRKEEMRKAEESMKTAPVIDNSAASANSQVLSNVLETPVNLEEVEDVIRLKEQFERLKSESNLQFDSLNSNSDLTQMVEKQIGIKGELIQACQGKLLDIQKILGESTNLSDKIREECNTLSGEINLEIKVSKLLISKLEKDLEKSKPQPGENLSRSPSSENFSTPSTSTNTLRRSDSNISRNSTGTVVENNNDDELIDNAFESINDNEQPQGRLSRTSSKENISQEVVKKN